MLGKLESAASGQASPASIQHYRMSLADQRLANEHLSLSFDFRQRNFSQEDFYGIGSDSEEKNRANFRLEDTDYRGTVGVRLARSLTVGALGGALFILPGIAL